MFVRGAEDAAIITPTTEFIRGYRETNAPSEPSLPPLLSGAKTACRIEGPRCPTATSRTCTTNRG